MSPNLTIDREAVADFCRRWDITQLWLFGSVLRDDFGPESDVDVLVTYGPDARLSLFAHHDMQAELAAVFGHPVDVMSRKSIEQSANWIRRRAILESAELYYAA